MDIFSSSALHLVMATLVGASVMAASAYYVHRRTVDQLLEFKRRIDEEQQNELEHTVAKKRAPRYHSKTYSRNSNSMPDFTAARGLELHNDEHRRNCGTYERVIGAVEQRRGSFANLTSIPSGLPRVQTRREGSRQFLTPKSPVTNASVYESVEGSDEEDETLGNEEEGRYAYEDAQADTMTDDLTAIPEDQKALASSTPDLMCANGEKTQKATNGIIKSHSISGDLHGIHAADPVAANILRKEPEQETFARLNISPIEPPSSEEAEVCLMLQECLALRERYVFREKIPPWEKEVITDPGTPRPNPDPFLYVPEAKTEHHFQMENGVVQVYANKDAKETLFPVADATTFFTDLHRILRMIALGNVRTLCHHRLRLLEQKFSLHLMLNADREFLAQKKCSAS